MNWKLAVRNVIVHRRRTLFLVLSLALSSFILAMGGTLVESLRSNIELGLRDGLAGDLQVFHSANPLVELTSEVPADFLPVLDATRAKRILLEDPDVVSVASRSTVSGLLLAGDSTAPVILIGIDPVAEAAALETLAPGIGAPLGGRGRILLGEPIAGRLGLHEGHGEVTVLLPTSDGLFEGDRFQVEGLYSPPGLPLVDELVAFVPLEHLQMLLGDEGYPDSLVVRLRESAEPVLVRERLERSLAANDLDLTVRSWDELAGNLLGMVQIGRFLVGSGFILILVVVLVGITNTLMILMLERTRSIGLMRALGTARSTILQTLVGEIAVVSTGAAALGALVAFALCLLLTRTGIPATSKAMTYVFGGPRFFPDMSAEPFLAGFLIVALVGPLVALVPASESQPFRPGRVP